MNTLGQQIRTMRSQTKIGLNDYAQKLGVSAGYLSNLETGKTDTIQLKVLDTVLNDLGFSALDVDTDSTTEQRLKRINSLLINLHKESPEAFEYFASNLEQGIKLFSNYHVK